MRKKQSDNKVENPHRKKIEQLRSDLEALHKEREATSRHFEKVSASILRIEGAIQALEELGETDKESTKGDGHAG